MKFLHLADLHFGKSIYGLSMLENGDQQAWVENFLALAEEVKTDAVAIAGDVYDRSSPSGEAVELLDHMLMELSWLGIETFVVAGNHDSGQRLSFASELLSKQHLHIAGVLPKTKELNHVTLEDEHGAITFWLLPYVFPALVTQVLEDDSIHDYDTAVRKLLEAQNIDFSQRNVIIAHQNVTAAGEEAIRGGSESMVGGLGQIDYTAFDGFDYVALGHIHSAYHVGKTTVRYAGTPLCYHFEETKQAAKGPVLVTLNEKGTEPAIETLHISPLHPMREARGSFDELRRSELAAQTKNEYVRVVLTDQRASSEIYNFFQEVYQSRNSVLMELRSEYNEFTGVAGAPEAQAVESKSTEELFADFYTERNGGEGPTNQELDLLQFAGEQLRHADISVRPDKQDVDKLMAFLLKQEEKK